MQAIKHRIKKATSTRKGKIIFFTILFVVIGAIAGALLYWQYNKKWIIRNELESAIMKKSKGLYKIKYDKMDLDEVAGFLSVTNLSLEYDSLEYADLVQLGIAPPTLFNIHIPEIVIYGVKTPRALIDKEIAGRKLEIKNPSIEIVLTSAGKDSARHTPSKEVYEQILGNLNQISVDTLQISGATITTSNLKTKRQNIGLYNAFIELLDVKVDSTANADTTRMLFSKTITLNCDSLSWRSPNNLYRYGADSLSLSSAGNTVHIGRFYIDPQLGEGDFVHSLSTQQDRFDLSMQEISIRNIDFYKLLDENIIADTIVIDKATLKVYRDLTIPRDNKNRVGTYPQQAIAKIPVPLEIKKITIKNAFIEYKEKNDKTLKTGKVQFYNSAAQFTNVTNKKEVIADNHIMTVDIHSSFLNKTSMRTLWQFYLNDPDGRFDIKGNLGSMNAKDLNSLTEPMGPAHIEDGYIKSLDFSFTGNDYAMNGNVKLLYDDLNVSILEKNETTGKLDKKGLSSFVANVLIKNSNPSGKNEPRTISVEEKRNTNRSMFHLSWHTLLKGIKETAGIKDKSK